MDILAAARALFQRGNIPEAAEACRQQLARDAQDVDALALLADIQLSGGREGAAIPALTEIARLQPQNAPNLRRLGGALIATGRIAEAIEVLEKAVQLDSANPRGHNNLGQAFLQAGKCRDAMRHLRQAVALNPHYAIGHYNLGLACSVEGMFEEAVVAFDRALTLDDRLTDALSARGRALLGLHRAEAAIASFDAAIAKQGPDAKVLADKASAQLILGRAANALETIARALALQPKLSEALHIRAAILCRLNRPEKALRCFDELLDGDPANVEAWCDRAVAYQQVGDQLAAADCCHRAIALDPQSCAARLSLIAALIPAVAPFAPELARARTVFEQELASFETWLNGKPLTEREAWAVASQQFFYLSYQELPNKTVLQRFRGASSARLQQLVTLPPLTRVVRRSLAPRRLRVGIVSAHIFDHSVFHAIAHGWLQHLDGRLFETTLFSLGTARDAATQVAYTLVGRVEADGRSPRAWATAICERDLDALLFPELGIDRTTLALASLRLAERQFVCWGHPDTTGIPTIDGFLSAECFEPDDADDHYSERLFRLPNLGTYYIPFEREDSATADLQVHARRSGPTFICPGTPFKYQPEYDALLTEIAMRVGPCTFVFFEHERIALSRALRERIATQFQRRGLDPVQYMTWIPWQTRAAFRGLLERADVFLDTIGFSGFNTMMQSIEAGLPAVAFEGMYMRGRLGSGILRHLGLAELVATSTVEYVDIAVRLAGSPALRSALRSKLAQVAHLAYRDSGAMHALSELLLSR